VSSVPPGSEAAPPPELVRSHLSDGDWHRLHPLTPFLRGGFALVVVAGIVITNFRDRLIEIFVPELREYAEYPGDPLDWVLANNLVLVALLVVLGVVLLLIAMFYISWRFHTFRITGDDVEVRSGVLFRTHRRAPLDRVQGVNLTRPMVARLFGAAKLEVVGAGADGNVKLEYLSTANAEAVRADILRLASGAQLGSAQAPSEGSRSRVSAAASVVSAGITGIIEGAEGPVAEPESVVNIPLGRLIGSRLLSGATIGLLFAIGAIVVGSIVGTPWILFGMVPAVLGFGAYWISSITKSLRYSIAPTSSGVRITFGLFTTTTEILPPGRVHAVQVSQSVLWRRFGWWTITVNRLSGRSAADPNADQFATVLPVGTRTDVERVLRLVLPGMPDDQWSLVFEHGLLGPGTDDPYTNTPRRARWLRPLSWRRNGFDLSAHALFVRRGFIWRKLGIFPLARLQSVGLTQGPVDRSFGVANLHPHTITGPVSGILGIIDRDAALGVFERVAASVVAAVATDRSHRWADADPGIESADAAVPANDADPQAEPANDAGQQAEPGIEAEPHTATPAQRVPPVAPVKAEDPPGADASPLFRPPPSPVTPGPVPPPHGEVAPDSRKDPS
jgi:putative membrane protein